MAAEIQQTDGSAPSVNQQAIEALKDYSVKDAEEVSNPDTVPMSVTTNRKIAVLHCDKLQLLTLAFALVSLVVSTWSLVETKRAKDPMQVTYPPLKDSLPAGQIDGEDEHGRNLFAADGTCSSNCGMTYCADDAYVTTGRISATAGCLPYSVFKSYLSNTLVPRIQADHEEWGLDIWNSEGFSAQCVSSAVDSELYNRVGSYSCTRSVTFAVATQLSCSGFTGLGSCGGSSGGFTGGGSSGSSNVMCIPYCLCRTRVSLGGSSNSYSSFDSCSSYGVTASECGCSF